MVPFPMCCTERRAAATTRGRPPSSGGSSKQVLVDRPLPAQPVHGSVIMCPPVARCLNADAHRADVGAFELSFTSPQAEINDRGGGVIVSLIKAAHRIQDFTSRDEQLVVQPSGWGDLVVLLRVRLPGARGLWLVVRSETRTCPYDCRVAS